jgi:protocatechuate 3,4-dioxygenase beta subunit
MKMLPGTILALLIFQSWSSYAQGMDEVLRKLENDLAGRQVSISNILSDEQYMNLHSKKDFRELIKKYAGPGSIKIVSEKEPGKRTKVVCTVTDKLGIPINNALVYFYQTSAKGWYSDTAAHILVNEGDHRHARLFGYSYTDKEGKIEIETIQPAGYPNSGLPAHIHISMWRDGNIVQGVPGELLFEDDIRLTEERKQRAIREGFVISKNAGTDANPVYNYLIKI